MKETIKLELRKIEKEYGVRILHAVESGSRAWGFASPDSDYDVRFIYARPMSDYLRLNEPRDVIEWKLDEVLDINGWDVRKALKHIAQANATLFEWNNSPIVYETTPEWDRVRAISHEYFSKKVAVNHYYGTAASTWAKHLTGETVKYKKYFYALRPLLAAQYIEQYHKEPPVLFADLLKMDLELSLRLAIDRLLAVKRETTEADFLPHIPEIQEFIRNEIPRQKAIGASLNDDRNYDWTALDRLYVHIICPSIE